MSNPAIDLTAPVPSRLRALDYLLVAAVVLAAIMPTLHGQFVPVDDFSMLVTPEQMREPTWHGFLLYWSGPMYRIYMPLALSLWQAIAYFAYHPNSDVVMQFDTMPYKIASMVIHVAASLAATWVLGSIIQKRWPAIVGGLVFGLHPIQVEAICWTTGQKDLLCGLFAVLSIGFYVNWLRQQPAAPVKSWRWWATMVCALLSMLSKPTGMMIPVALVALDFAFRRVRLSRRMPALAPFFLPAAVCAAIILFAQGDSPVVRVALWARPLLMGDTVTYYLYKIILPIRMSEDYGRHPQYVWQTGEIWWTWIFSAAVLVGLLIWRNRLALLAMMLFLAPLAPVIGLTRFDMQQFSTPNDHYIYQSMLGVALLVAVLMQRGRLWLDGAAVAVLLILAVLTWQQTTLWKNPLHFYRRVAELNPRSWMAYTSLAGIYAEAGDVSFGLRSSNYSLQLNPEFSYGYPTRAAILARLGRFRDSADDLRAAIRLGRGSIDVGQHLMLCGVRLRDPQIALEGVKEWLRNDPGNQRALISQRQIQRALDRQSTTAPSSQPAVLDGN